MNSISLRFGPQQAKLILKLLVTLEICMVILYLLDHRFHAFGRPHRIIDLDQEFNIPSWFSSAQLFLIGILFLLQNFRYSLPKNISLKLLSFVGLGFIFLSMDEAVMIHEWITLRFMHIPWLPRFNGNHGLWIPFYTIAGLTFLTVSRQAILEVWRSYRKEFILFGLGFLIMLTGGVGLEIFSYEYLRVDGLENWYILETAVEEGLEMMGASIILYATLLFTIEENS